MLHAKFQNHRPSASEEEEEDLLYKLSLNNCFKRRELSGCGPHVFS